MLSSRPPETDVEAANAGVISSHQATSCYAGVALSREQVCVNGDGRAERTRR